ncbi:unnamed protein product [Nesidiocoris tenuis]|uniref:Uncharacterized protein n=1 Tax=Nesidiocoris tenuis TaxID=355587 RepID=A0A6H5GSV9_9HEMI|nr:unnamed protein product [Nesidiocoris tenuis]
MEHMNRKRTSQNSKLERASHHLFGDWRQSIRFKFVKTYPEVVHLDGVESMPEKLVGIMLIVPFKLRMLLPDKTEKSRRRERWTGSQ